MKKFKFNKFAIASLVVMSVLVFVGAMSVSAFTSPATVNLGKAGNFAVLSKTAVSNTGATSITGDVGVSPAAATFLTGFSPTMDSSNTFSTSTYVTGKLYGADYTAPTPSYLTTAVSDMEAAYNDAAGRPADVTELGSGNIGGMTLTAGVYKWSTGVTIPTGATLSGSSTDVFIFEIAGNLDIASAQTINLVGGVSPANIFWVVGGTTTLNTTSTFEGNILAGPGTSIIAMNTGAILHGKALGQKNISLQANTITSAVGANPHLTVTKVVVNNSGSNLQISNFPLFVDGTLVTSGASNSYTDGTHVVTETTNSNYAQSFSGACDSTGHVSLFPGDDVTCTITNDDIATISSGGTSSSGGGTIYGCKDPTATNYNYFSSSKPSLCTYASATTTITQQIPVVVPTPAVIVPKLPKTGFPPQDNSPWYMILLSDILNLIK